MPWSKDHCVSLSRLLSKYSQLVSILPSSVQQVLTVSCQFYQVSPSVVCHRCDHVLATKSHSAYALSLCSNQSVKPTKEQLVS